MRVKGLGGTDAAERARVVRRVRAVLVFQLLDHVCHEARVKVLASEVRVARSGLYLQEGKCKATWKREFKLPWRKAGLLTSTRRLSGFGTAGCQ